MLEHYVDALRQHINESTEDLDSIHELLRSRSWTRIERKGAERLLQGLVEASIGVSRHWLKQQGKTVPPDAYAVFEKLIELQPCRVRTAYRKASPAALVFKSYAMRTLHCFLPYPGPPRYYSFRTPLCPV